jgi:sortase A
MKKKRLFSAIIANTAIILVFLTGLSIFLYPIVSDYINSQYQTRVVNTYLEDVDDMEDSEVENMLEKAHAYNEWLRQKPDRFQPFTDDETTKYFNQINPPHPDGRGVMGVLEIERLGILLPIYHGTSEAVLQIGLGHLESSSLPVGGETTHAVITGHRGLPSSMLLTNLDRMELGDTFMIRVLTDELFYKVDQIRIVTPDEWGDLKIERNMDYCTLMTCTPYGINSHRMLVRGVRADSVTRDDVLSEAQEIGRFTVLISVISVLSVVILACSVVLSLIVRLRKKIQKKT